MTKDEIINLRVSSDQKAKLRSRATSGGKTLTGYILARCFAPSKPARAKKGKTA